MEDYEYNILASIISERPFYVKFLICFGGWYL